MATAAARIMNGKTLNAGQICLAPDYVFAPQDQVETFVEEAKAGGLVASLIEKHGVSGRLIVGAPA